MSDAWNALSQMASGPLLSVLGLWTAGMFSILKTFDFVDSRISKAAKLDATRYLQGVNVRDAFNGLSRLFRKSFQTVFGAEHFTFRSYVSSVTASIITTTLLALFVLPYGLKEGVTLSDVWFELPSTILVVALVPDFLSLGKSRWLMRRMEALSSLRGVAGLVLIDVVLSIAIARVWLTLCYSVLFKHPILFRASLTLRTRHH